MPGSGGPGPDEQYCPDCGSVVGRSVDACPYCGADGVGLDTPSDDAVSRAAVTGSDDPRTTSDRPTDAGELGFDRGLVYALVGAFLMVLSVLTFIEGILTFSLLIGILLLPLSGLFGIAGTLLGYYSALAYRSRLGAGVGLVGTLEGLAVVGAVVLALLALLGVVAVSTPFGLVAELVELLRWVLEQVFGVVKPVVD